MALLDITVFKGLGRDASGAQTPFLLAPPLAVQQMTIDTVVPLQSSSFDTEASFVRLHADAAAFCYAFGRNPYVPKTAARLEAGSTLVFGVKEFISLGGKIAVVAAATVDANAKWPQLIGTDSNALANLTNTTVTKNQADQAGTANAAWLVDDGLAAGAHNAYNSNLAAVTINKNYTYSVYAKAGSSRWLQLTANTTCFGASQWANFDLVDGTVTYETGLVQAATIEPAGNGFYRCSITVLCTASSAGTATGAVALINSATAARYPSYTGANNTIIVHGFQLEGGVVQSPYIPVP